MGQIPGDLDNSSWISSRLNASDASPEQLPQPDCGKADEGMYSGTPSFDSLKKQSELSMKQIGKFRLIRFIGAGGMGEVHLARHHVTGELVALKIIRGKLSMNPDIRKRFLTEALVMKKIQHVNVVRLHDIDEDEGYLFFTMEHLTGCSLKELIRDCRTTGRFIPFQKILSLIQQVCRGLEAAHKKGIVHRDLKPGNVFLSIDMEPDLIDPEKTTQIVSNMIFNDNLEPLLDESVKVLDFGLAKILGLSDETVDGQQLGTPYYMAPEQCDGRVSIVDSRADVYSLGVIFYELLTCKLPTGMNVTLPSHVRDDVYPEIDQIVSKCLEHDPAKRYKSTTEVMDALRGIQNFVSSRHFVDSKTERREELPEPKIALFDQRKYRMIGLGIIGLIILLIATFQFNQLLSERSSSILTDTTQSNALVSASSLEVVDQVNASTPIEDAMKPSQPAVPIGYLYINPGTFRMGSPDSEIGRDSDEIAHEVTLTEGFWMKETEVTQAEFETVMGFNRSHFKGPNRPVETVSWSDAINYCIRLSLKENLTPSYEWVGDSVVWDRVSNGYRLPTEAEWEYACRAGSTSRFCFGDSNTELDDYGWYSENSDSQTHDVKEKKPNDWGLYDMHGNVWEWCWDWKGTYPSEGSVDPTGSSSNSSDMKRIVFRGGAWQYVADSNRSANRNPSTATRDNTLGFRPVRSEGFE